MDYDIPSKPIIYKNTKFRSRLEARWAVFFDLIGWSWQYEEYDLRGWTPDFIIYGKNKRIVLIEVKPYLTESVLSEYSDKISKALKQSQLNCILLDNNFHESSEYTALRAGVQVGFKIYCADTFNICPPFEVHWKNHQNGINSEYDIGSCEMNYDGSLWGDLENRKDFIWNDSDGQILKSLWVKAGVLSSFQYG